jgi:hypothetical protein
VRVSRRFGYPGRIDAHERVWLTCAGLSDRAEVWLNGQALGTCTGAFELEVTALLKPRNELVLEVDGPAEGGGVWGEVALEVRCTAFLRGVRAWAVPPGVLHVAGEVVGWADGPLELYVILGRYTAAYAAVTAGAEGVPFHLMAADLPPERWRAEEGGAEPGPVLRIELVKGASVWYAWEQPCPLPATHTEES